MERGKAEQLRNTRGVSFEEIVNTLQTTGALDDYPHPNQTRYPGQRIYVVEIRGYLYNVPYVTQNDGVLFLKPAFASSRAMRRYGRRRGL